MVLSYVVFLLTPFNNPLLSRNNSEIPYYHLKKQLQKSGLYLARGDTADWVMVNTEQNGDPDGDSHDNTEPFVPKDKAKERPRKQKY